MSNDLDSLLDQNLEDLEDLPEFAPFPPGVHIAVMQWTHKKIDDARQGYELKLTAVRTEEEKEPGHSVTPGQTDSTLFFLKHPNEKAVTAGQGKIKELLADVSAHFGGGLTLRDCLEKSNGLEVAVTTSLQAEKKDGKLTGRSFLRIDKLLVI